MPGSAESERWNVPGHSEPEDFIWVQGMAFGRVKVPALRRSRLRMSPLGQGTRPKIKASLVSP